MTGSAIVTGGARGIGKAIVDALLAQNVVEHVAVFDLTLNDALSRDGSGSDGDSVGDERVTQHVCDVTDEASVRAAYAEVGATPTVLVNNAGGGRLDNIAGIGPDDGPDDAGPRDAFDPFGGVEAFRDMVDLNLTSAHVVTRVIGPDLAPGAAICNTASIAGLRPGQLFSYGAAKAGLIHWTTSMAKALAPQQIRVNAVAPGIIRTQLWEAMMPDDDNYEAMINDIMPMQQDQTPEDIANAVAFLCSARASQITGEVIKIDGGLTLR